MTNEIIVSKYKINNQTRVLTRVNLWGTSVREVRLMICWGFWRHSTTTIQILAFRARRSRNLARRTSKLALDKSSGISNENTLLYAVCSDCEPIGLLKTEVWSEANLIQTQSYPKELLHTYSIRGMVQWKLIQTVHQMDPYPKSCFIHIFTTIGNIRGLNTSSNGCYEP